MHIFRVFRKPSIHCKWFPRFVKWGIIDLEYVDRPPTGDATILVGEGEYHETINVTRMDPITLLVRLPSLESVMTSSSLLALRRDNYDKSRRSLPTEMLQLEISFIYGTINLFALVWMMHNQLFSSSRHHSMLP